MPRYWRKCITVIPQTVLLDNIELYQSSVGISIFVAVPGQVVNPSYFYIPKGC